MTGWLALFDESLDTAALEERRTVVARVLTASVAVAFLALNVGVIVGAAWFGAVLACEAALWLSAEPLSPPQQPRLAFRMVYAVCELAQTVAWTASAVLYWSTGRPALQIVAVAILAGQLLHAQSFAFQSRLALILGGVPPTLCLIVLPTFFGGFGGLAQFTVALSLVVAVLYAINAARENLATTRALRKAQEDARAQTERALAANAAKSSFLAMMSHELRTPMNGVLGMAHALKATQLDPRQADYVGMLVKSGDGLMTLLNDILDISKVEAGKLEFEHVPFDLRDLGARACDLWSDVAAEKGVKLVYEVDPTAPDWVTGDPTRVRQIMLNLISNALKFTREGEVRLRISAAPPTRASDGVEIAVSDTGVGIADEQHSHIFSVFAQADASTARNFGGSGLGLAICKQLAEGMGGDIVLESRLGEGSTFTVTLPLPAAEGDHRDEPHAEGGDLAGRSILVVEDNPINRTVARAILEATGATVVTANDGLEALEALRAGDFDVVLMDVHMPRLGGPETLARIRAGEAGRPDTPVIALTADAFAAEDGWLAALGFDAVQPKPIRPAELLSVIAQRFEDNGPARATAQAAQAG
ncbi:MAG: ATP-binding protein [Caulobacteraceae bacterium]|nr:ATP-binding protein [Caulobacteraceae bacterium]